jgi:hypothetical protein
VNFEGLDGVLVECGNENDNWQILWSNRIEHFEAGHAERACFFSHLVMGG